jgi:hypothetical protein
LATGLGQSVQALRRGSGEQEAHGDESALGQPGGIFFPRLLAADGHGSGVVARDGLRFHASTCRNKPSGLPQNHQIIGDLMVPAEGIEPPHPHGYQILSLARLPIPPRRHTEKANKSSLFARLPLTLC